MNILSLLSSFSAYSLVFGGVYTLNLNSRSPLNRLAALVDFSFAVWAFCYVFFHAAASSEEAWFWHRLAAFGWVPFSAFAFHFFLVLSERDRKLHGPVPYIVLYGLPVPLLLYALFGKGTPIAAKLLPLGTGPGWRVVSDPNSPWFWAFLAYLIVYFSVGFVLVCRWVQENDDERRNKQAKSLVVWSLLLLLIVLCTDVVSPALGRSTPPLGSPIAVFWLVGFIFIVRKSDLLSFHNAATANLVLETIMDPVLLLDRKGMILKCNRATSILLGLAPADLLRRPLSLFIKHGYDQRQIDTLFNRKRLTQVPLALMDSRGRVIDVLASLSLAETMLDGPIGIVVNLHDVTSLKKTEAKLIEREEKARSLAAELHKAAHYDKLTELPNRRFFFIELEDALARAGEPPFAVAFIDLDGFKAINDTRGHDVGDALLTIVAERLRSILKEGDIAARMGGDEFVILFRDGSRSDASLLEDVKRPFSSPFVVAGSTCRIELSAGLSRFPKDGSKADQLMKAADERMYLDKISRRGFDDGKKHFHQGPGRTYG